MPKTMTTNEAAKAAEEAAHAGLISWITQLRDELEEKLNISTNELDDWFFEKHFVWAIEVALGRLAPITILPDPDDDDEE
jgi:hypothetical protein